MIELVEQFVCGKRPDPDQCEDGIFVSDHFVAVIDGVTAKTDRTYGGRRPGRVCRDLLLSALSQLPREVTARACFEHLTEAVASWYAQQGLGEAVRKDPTCRASASIAVYSDHRREVWRVGDSDIRIGNRLYEGGLMVDALYVELRLKAVDFLTEAGLTEAEAAEIIPDWLDPLHTRQQAFENNPESKYGYAILNGVDVPAHKTFPVGSARQVCLASDGYPALLSTLEACEAHLAKILEEDPHCLRLFRHETGLRPGFSSYDDRAYVRFRV